MPSETRVLGTEKENKAGESRKIVTTYSYHLVHVFDRLTGDGLFRSASFFTRTVIHLPNRCEHRVVGLLSPLGVGLVFRLLLAVSVGLLIIGPSYAQPVPPSRTEQQVFELRTYTVVAGRLDELHTRFREHTIRLLEKHGATSLGFWVPSDNSDNKLVFLLSYPTQSARNRTWSTLVADPEWLRVKQSSEHREGKLVERIESRFLAATEYSPALRPVRETDQREFELRTITADAARAEAAHTKLRTETLPELERNGAVIRGVWTVRSASESETTILYLVARTPRVGESEADSVIASLNGVGMRRPAVRPDSSILLLRATDYSPMK